jgi:hypothetical protein
MRVHCTVLLDTMPCNVVDIYQCFGGICCLHLQGRRPRRERKQGKLFREGRISSLKEKATGFTATLLYIYIHIPHHTAPHPKIRDSSLGLVTCYGLNGSISGRGKRYSLLHCVQSGSGDHPASYPMGTGGSFPGVKRLEREADHSHPSSAEINYDGAIPPLPHTSSLRGG